jgi:hypothetical protein
MMLSVSMSRSPEQPPPNQDRPSILSSYPISLWIALFLGGGYLVCGALWGAGDPLGWKLFGGALLCGILGTSGWWLLSKTPRVQPGGSGSIGFWPWLAFPLTLLGIIGALPLLLLAVFPELRERLDPHNRIEARTLDGKLEIIFPQPMQPDTVNVQFDEIPIPASLFRQHPELSEWRDVERNDHRLLIIEIDRLKEKISFPPIQRVGFNSFHGKEQMLDHTGKRLPQQWVEISSP